MLCLTLKITSLNHHTFNFKVHIISTCPEIQEINIPQYKSKVLSSSLSICSKAKFLFTFFAPLHTKTD